MADTRSAVCVGLLLVLLHASRAAAEEPPPGDGAPPLVDPIADPPRSEAPPPPAPYSLPWQLRPVLAVTAVRSDTSVAVHDVSTTTVSFLGVSQKVRPDIAVAARLGFVVDVSNAGEMRSAFTNTALSATHTWSRPREPFRFAATGGVVVPSGQGGGSAPDPDDRRAIGKGALARSAMDNAMFAPNDLGLFAGGAIAYVADGYTVQLECTVFELVRMKGEKLQKELSKTNSTWGAHVGVFLLPALSLGAEIRYQAFLIAPQALPSERRDTLTAALGLRAHLVADGFAFRPGISYTHPIDDPMAMAAYRIAQLDLPFIF